MGIALYLEGTEEFYIQCSYTTFREIKEQVALALNIQLSEMKGHYKKHPVDEGYYKVGWKNWDEIKSNLKLFLITSDGEGKWSYEEVEKFCNEYMQIVDKWEVRSPDDHFAMVGKKLGLLFQESIKQKKNVCVG